MSRTSKILNTVQSPDQILNLLYGTGYRLTGNHQLTAKLIDLTISELDLSNRQWKLNGNKNKSVNVIFKTLCTAFINKSTVVCGPDYIAAPLHNHKDFCKHQIQEALLYLPPMERLLVVLKDILGLTYVEIADLTGLEKSDVSCLLSMGRWSLRKILSDVIAPISF